jgi:glutamine amidotransferase
MDHPSVTHAHWPGGRSVITVVDLGVSNVRSVTRAFGRIGVDVRCSTSTADVATAALIVLPGVGAFRDGMARLHELSLIEPIRRAVVEEGTPIAGICLGMQLLADESFEHGHHEGLGLVPGQVVRLEPDEAGFRVPNIGWYDLRPVRHSLLTAPELELEAAYFVHSYHLVCRDASDVVATIDYSGRSVVAAVERANVCGVQFHPEKSQDTGLAVLDAIARLVDDRERAA